MSHSQSSAGSTPFHDGQTSGNPPSVEEEQRALLTAARRREARLRREISRLREVVEDQGARLHHLDEDNMSLTFDLAEALRARCDLEDRLAEMEAVSERRRKKILLVAGALGVTADNVSPDLPPLYPPAH